MDGSTKRENSAVEMWKSILGYSQPCLSASGGTLCTDPLTLKKKSNISNFCMEIITGVVVIVVTRKIEDEHALH